MKRSVFLFAICFICPCWGAAQTENPAFSHLTQETGLPGSISHVMILDPMGFLWIGMQDGLLRWDGRHFRRFQSIRGDSTSLPCTLVQDLAEDPDGSIWVATVGGGLCRFNPVTNRFRRYPLSHSDPGALSDPNAFSLCLDSNNDLWVGVLNAGLNRLNRQTNTFERFPIARDLKNEQEAYLHNTVRDIVEDIGDRNILWLATNEGIARFEKSSGTVRSFHTPGGEYVHVLWTDKAGELWVGLNAGGLARFDTRTFEWHFYPFNPDRHSPQTNICRGIIPKNEQELWICSPDMGFGVFNKISGVFHFFRQDTENPLSILANSANAAYRDRQNRVWVAHLDKGISILDPKGPPFTFQSLPMGDCRLPEQGSVGGFCFDPTRHCYFVAGYACDGLFMLDQHKRFVKKIPAQGKEGAAMAYQCLLSDRAGRIWAGGLGTLGSWDLKPLWVLSPGEEKLRPYVHHALPKRPFNIFDIHEDRKGNLWLATDYLGLVKLDFERDTVVCYVKSIEFPQAPSAYVHVKQVKEDRQGRLWLATQGEGVFCFDPETAQFRQWLHLKTGYNGLQETRVNALAPDDQGRIWLATSGNGIQVLDPANTADPIILQWGEPQGLPSPRINNLARDDAGNLWITTENGLCYYQASTAKVVRYSAQDGIMSKGFYEQGLEVLVSGDVFIGQKGGFYAVHPATQVRRGPPSRLVFSAFSVFEQERFFEKDLNYTDVITLRHDENYFTIAFSELGYSRSKGPLLAYRLQGYDADWNYPANNRGIASYTQVPPGQYTFRVTTLNNDFNGTETAIISLTINILPPWWRSWWVYSLYCIGALAVMYFFYKIRFQQQLAQQEARRLQELDTFKTRFFANISHEFRTPLTMLIGPAENALNHWPEMKTDDLRGILHTVRRNGYRLLNLVNQLLDLSRLEAGKLRITPVNGDLVAFLRYQVESCHSYAETRNIRILFKSDLSELPMAFDPEKIQVIAVNLLSNALKFTPDGGMVKVELRMENGELPHPPRSILDSQFSIIVTDTGSGIPAQELGKIFDRFYQVDNSTTRQREGAGIGLALVQELVKLMQGTVSVESTVGAGTTFLIRLPYTPPQAEWQTLHLKSADTKIPMSALLTPLPSTSPEGTVNVREDSSFIIHHSSLPHLLIIEDNPDVMDYLKTCLKGAYQLELAYNGKTGIEKALETIPDLIISDVMMPEKNGYEVCDTLKNDERTSHIPIVLLTAKADIASKIAGLRRGADAYLPKPFHLEELLVQLEMLVERQKRMVAHFSKKVAGEPPMQTSAQQEDYEVEDAFMQKVRQVIEEHFADEDFALPSLCEKLNMSRSQLFRKMKALADISPSDLIRTHRLQKAKSLLLRGGLTVSEVAWQVGYKEVSHFSKSFQDMYGHSPGSINK